MRVVLAEKPSVAREIAAVLGADARRDGYFEGRGCQVTWALGHLVTLKEPQDYDPALRRWSLETLPFVPDRFALKPISEKGAGKQLSDSKGASAAISTEAASNSRRSECRLATMPTHSVKSAVPISVLVTIAPTANAVKPSSIR